MMWPGNGRFALFRGGSVLGGRGGHGRRRPRARRGSRAGGAAGAAGLPGVRGLLRPRRRPAPAGWSSSAATSCSGSCAPTASRPTRSRSRSASGSGAPRTSWTGCASPGCPRRRRSRTPAGRGSCPSWRRWSSPWSGCATRCWFRTSRRSGGIRAGCDPVVRGAGPGGRTPVPGRGRAAEPAARPGESFQHGRFREAEQYFEQLDRLSVDDQRRRDIARGAAQRDRPRMRRTADRMPLR